MMPTRITDSTLNELNSRTKFVLSACGYEQRASALLDKLSKTIVGRVCLAFREHPGILHRPDNDRKFGQGGFASVLSSGNSSTDMRTVVAGALETVKKTGGALAFDISSMTRAWQGAIIQILMTYEWDREIETYFVYVPRQFDKPPRHECANEIVGPVQGFGALAPPDLPIALVLSLGYERNKALGLMEILDPGQTVLLIAKSGEEDSFYSNVLRNNREILRRVSDRWFFSYPLRQPTATLQILESICGGLSLSYRVVLAPMGPKVFALLCFLTAAKRPE